MKTRQPDQRRLVDWRYRLDLIERDTSIQCRAAIDTATVNEYAERMEEGDVFPCVELFSPSPQDKTGKAYIGDGWHRIMAAEQIGAEEINANVHLGGRLDALKCALEANSMHGLKRSNADKRRCVEVALREFKDLSSRALAEMCGVGHELVEASRQIQLAESANSQAKCRTGRDHKSYPVRPKATGGKPSKGFPEPEEWAKPEASTASKEWAPEDENQDQGGEGSGECNAGDGLELAQSAIEVLNCIQDDDPELSQAMETVIEYAQGRCLHPGPGRMP